MIRPSSSAVSCEADQERNRNIQALGAFVDPQWDPTIYQNLLRTDVISREINGLWRASGAQTYVSYTFLNDDVNGTKCYGPTPAPTGTALPGDTNGPPSTKYCADGGVYYLNRLSADSSTAIPDLVAPYGFDSLLNFGILPWYPTAGSARAYRALNNVSSETPVYDTAAAEAAYNDYIIQFSSTETADLVNLIGQTPGTWNLPVCDQGYNTWTFDWTNQGGLPGPTAQDFPAVPCACGHQGSGTENFYTALGVPEGQIKMIAGYCKEILLTVAPGLPNTPENIGWNAIAGGPPESIVMSPSQTVQKPASIPTTVCYTQGYQVTNCPVVGASGVPTSPRGGGG
ncbi:hypothetical protein P7C71_g5562, partial [Lecanoromycetidae sp. Uapishka_2]